MNPRILLFQRAACAALLFLGAGYAQNQPPVHFVRDYCVKVANGKSVEHAAWVRDVATKLMQARVDEGQVQWGVIASVISPAGTTARCDYHVVYGYDGKLPEPPDAAAVGAALKRAGLKMTAEEWMARRDSLSRLVSVEVSQEVESVEVDAPFKYIRVNHYKVRSGQSTASWLGLERNTWKPLVAADNANGHKSGWNVYVIMMPSGETVWANGVTVDLFTDWESLMRGIPVNELWPKVHQNRNMSEWLDRLSTVVDRQLVEIARVEVFAQKKSAGATGGAH